MDFRDIQNLSEAYLSIYEANRGDEYMTRNMTPSQKRRAKQTRRNYDLALTDRSTHKLNSDQRREYIRNVMTPDRRTSSGSIIEPSSETNLSQMRQRLTRERRGKKGGSLGESYDYILSYLLDEGYDLTDFSLDEIYDLYEKVVSGYNKFPQEKVNKQMDRHIDRAATFSNLEKAYRDTPEGQETPWGKGTVKGSPKMAKHAKDLYDRSIDRHVKMSMASQYHDPNKVQSKQRVNRIIGDMKRDRENWNKEDSKANKKRQEKYVKFRRSEVHPPSSPEFVPFSKSKKRSSLPHQTSQGVSHDRPSVGRNVSFRKSSTGRSPFHREELEYLISYLLDEGYATNLESAEVILNSMSEGWKTDVLKSALKTTGKIAKYGAKEFNRSKFGRRTKNFVKRTALGALGVPLVS